MTSVVVVGGGIAGLAAARRLALAGCTVTVLEAGRRWGGKIASVRLDGARLDVGAESVLARRPEAVALANELGLAGQLVHPTPATSQVLINSQVHALPPSMMGVPRDLDVLAGYLSDEGLTRARSEPSLPAPALTGDVPIGRYVDERFGPEVTDRLLEPLLGGVYAGHARTLSFEAVARPLFERARTGGSLLEHARQSAVTTASGPVFAGLSGGIGTLVDALVADLDRLGVHLHLATAVRELAPAPGGGYRLVTGPAGMLGADAVVLAAPAGPTGRLLRSLVPVADDVAAVPYASFAVVTLVLQGAELAGSGMLVPPGELPTIKALTYSSTKWAWTGELAAATWGAGTAVVRASVGRYGEAALLQLDDEALLQRTWAEATGVPGWAGARLVRGAVTRWGGALPQYLLGHRQLVDRLRTSLADHPGLAVCGALLDGVGIPASLASADRAVADILTDLSGPVAAPRTPDLPDTPDPERPLERKP